MHKARESIVFKNALHQRKIFLKNVHAKEILFVHNAADTFFSDESFQDENSLMLENAAV